MNKPKTRLLKPMTGIKPLLSKGGTHVVSKKKARRDAKRAIQRDLHDP